MNRVTCQQGIDNRQSVLIAIAVTLLIAYPVLFAIAYYGIEAPFRFFAADAFYYLNIAHNIGKTPIFSFDGIYPTNGFHPLWQYYLSATFSLLNSQNQEIYFATFSSILFMIIGGSLITIALSNRRGSVPIVLLGLT